MGIVDATTLILLQKMMADSYEHGRVVWKENRARCALTGEAESDDVRTHPYQSPIEMSADFVCLSSCLAAQTRRRRFGCRHNNLWICSSSSYLPLESRSMAHRGWVARSGRRRRVRRDGKRRREYCACVFCTRGRLFISHSSHRFHPCHRLKLLVGDPGIVVSKYPSPTKAPARSQRRLRTLA